MEHVANKVLRQPGRSVGFPDPEGDHRPFIGVDGELGCHRARYRLPYWIHIRIRSGGMPQPAEHLLTAHRLHPRPSPSNDTLVGTIPTNDPQGRSVGNTWWLLVRVLLNRQ